ncbi:unnamed protein product [Camellia sinensis]
MGTVVGSPLGIGAGKIFTVGDGECDTRPRPGPLPFLRLLLRRWTPNLFNLTRSLRSNSAPKALAKASEEKTPIIVLCNYPSFSGAFSALFARLFHSHLNLPCLILPFSSVEPLSREDLRRNLHGELHATKWKKKRMRKLKRKRRKMRQRSK